VNEAFARLDALAQLVIQADDVTLPPLGALEGEVWAVPAGAVDAWAGQEGRLAVWLNGGWDFVTPREGWRAWIVDAGRAVLFDGAVWRELPLSEAASGAGLSVLLLEFEHAVQGGASEDTVETIPAGAVVLGVTLRVTQALGGAATSWRLGVAGAEDRYGSGLGMGLNAWGRGVTGAPVAYYAPTALRLTGEGGALAAGGAVRIAVHGFVMALPDPV
jgi:hypothetical protein